MISQCHIKTFRRHASSYVLALHWSKQMTLLMHEDNLGLCYLDTLNLLEIAALVERQQN